MNCTERHTLGSGLRQVLLLLLVLVVVPTFGSERRKGLVLSVIFEGRPIAGFAVEYFDGDGTLCARTDSGGIVVFDTTEDLTAWRLLWDLTPASEDYVFRDLRSGDDRWSVRAVRSATWRQRTHHRPCDEWRRTLDIPRGSLPTESADEYDAWYSSLPPESEESCNLLAKIETQVGSKAPWYFFEFKAMPPRCVDGHYESELDWTAWYRRLLEEATGAAPGLCVLDWERWWVANGYPALPKRPSVDAPPDS